MAATGTRELRTLPPRPLFEVLSSTRVVHEETTLQEERGDAVLTSVPVADHLFIVMECARPFAGGARADLEEVKEVVIGRGEERAMIRERRHDGIRLLIRV